MTKQSKVLTSLFFAVSLGSVVALSPSLARAATQQANHFVDMLKRGTIDLQGNVDDAAHAAGQVKKTAGKVEEVAGKTKATAARVEGVAIMGSKGLGILANKLSCGDEEVPEFVVQYLIEKSLEEHGVKVVEEDGAEVCNFRIFIGVDDNDDDNDGIPNAEDKDRFGDMDDEGANHSDIPDEQIIDIDLDKTDPEATEGLPDVEKEKGIFIVLAADDPAQVVVFHLSADSFSKVEAACSSGVPSGNASSIFSAIGSMAKQVLGQAQPAKDHGKALVSSWLSSLHKK